MGKEEFDAQLHSLTAKLEERSDGFERRIQKLEEGNETLNRLTVLVELQKESMDIMNKTLLKISESNNNISHEIQGIKEDVADVKNDVDKVTKKVENIESTDTINVPQAFKKASGWFLSAIVIGLAGYVLVQFGLK